MLRGLRLLERLGCQNNLAEVTSTGVREFDEAAQRLRDHVQRRAITDTNSRQQLCEVTSLLTQLDRRPSGADSTYSPGQRLRHVLEGMSNTIDSELRQLLSCSAEIEECMRELTDAAEQQSDAMSKTTTYVEQLSANLEAVSQNADTTHDAASTARQKADQTLDTVRDLVSKMEQIHSEVESGETKLLSLGDRWQEISSTVERVRDIASRTNLLALNASIESVRAGEHGRGFAVVAQEVHTLSEQSGQAAREIATLIEAVQLESRSLIADITNECAALEAETQRARTAVKDIEQIGRASNDAVTNLGEITFAAQHQRKLTHDLVTAVERISEVTKRARSCSEKAGWTTNTLAKTAQEFDESVAPLRRCSNGRASSAGNHSPVDTSRSSGKPSPNKSGVFPPRSGDLSVDRLTTSVQASLPTA
jgi:methyl-accepting chemotaxis protein